MDFHDRRNGAAVFEPLEICVVPVRLLLGFALYSGLENAARTSSRLLKQIQRRQIGVHADRIGRIQYLKSRHKNFSTIV